MRNDKKVKLAQLRRLLVREVPVTHLDSVHDGPVIHVVFAVKVDDLLNRTRIDARQPADALQQVPVGRSQGRGGGRGPVPP